MKSNDTRPDPADYNGVRDEIVRLRCLGHGPMFIARTLNVAFKRVQTILDNEFRDRFADREELKRQTAMQYDWLLRPIAQRYDGDRRDAETMLKILEGKKRLFALDDPVKYDVRVVEEMTDEELERQLELHGIRQLAPPPPTLPPVRDPVADADFVPVAAPQEQPLE